MPRKASLLQKLPETSWGDFSGGTVDKNPPATAGDTGLSPGSVLWSNYAHVPQLLSLLSRAHKPQVWSPGPCSLCSATRKSHQKEKPTQGTSKRKRQEVRKGSSQEGLLWWFLAGWPAPVSWECLFNKKSVYLSCNLSAVLNSFCPLFQIFVALRQEPRAGNKLTSHLTKKIKIISPSWAQIGQLWLEGVFMRSSSSLTDWDRPETWVGPFAAALQSLQIDTPPLEIQNSKKPYGTKNKCVHALGWSCTKRYEMTKNKIKTISAISEELGAKNWVSGAKVGYCSCPPNGTPQKGWANHLSHLSRPTSGHTPTLTPHKEWACSPYPAGERAREHAAYFHSLLQLAQVPQ